MSSRRKNNPTTAVVILGAFVLSTLAQAQSQTTPRPKPSVSPKPAPSDQPPPGPPGASTPNPPFPGPVVSPRPAPNPPPPAPGTPPAESSEITEAFEAGEQAGRRDGANEGNERGHADGLVIGGQNGIIDGRARCEDILTRQNFARGFEEGSLLGEREGQRGGHHDGMRAGSERGNREGAAAGQAQADAQAKKDAQEPGTREGNEQASRSDAAQGGRRDGVAQGERLARERARSFDYQAARDEQRSKFYSEKVEANESFSQRSAAKTAAGFSMSMIDRVKKVAKLTLGVTSLRGLRGDVDLSQAELVPSENVLAARIDSATNHRVPDPDFRYFDDSRPFAREAQTTAYRKAYRPAYVESFKITYRDHFDFSYRQAYAQSEPAGCALAQQLDYRPAHNQGFKQGREQAFRSAYDAQFETSAEAAFQGAFAPASEAAFRKSYPDLYKKHLETARREAYARRYAEIYDANRERASRDRYAEVYPGFAADENKRGKEDEIADFRQRPLRLLEASVLETIANGNFEPGETLRFQLKLRNFSASTLIGKDIRVQLVTADSGIVLAQGETVLVRDLKAKSVTEVRDALEFKLTEALARRTARARLVVTYQNRVAGEQELSLSARFQAEVRLARELTLSEGLPTEVALQVTNSSTVATEKTAVVRLLWDSALVEVPEPVVALGELRPGESRAVTLQVIARTPLDRVNAPIAAEVLASSPDQGTARRVGLLDLSRSVPVLNDYRITLSEAIDSLRGSGVTRARYKITNISSRLLFRGLQLKARVLNPEGQAVASANVVGPNPQFLKPVKKGESVEFVIPIVARHLGSGGILELEVQEDGTTVVVHRARF